MDAFLNAQSAIAGAVLICFGALKLADRHLGDSAASSAVGAWLGPVAAARTAYAVAGYEIVLGLSVLLIWSTLLEGILAFSLSAFLLYLAAVRILRPGVSCGCLGSRSTEPVGPWTLLRTGWLAVAALVGSLQGSPWQASDLNGGMASVLLAELLLTFALLTGPGLWRHVHGGRDTCFPLRATTGHALRALRRSDLWPRLAPILSSTDPDDSWRDGCFRYLSFAALLDQASAPRATVVVAVHVRTGRPIDRYSVVAADRDELLAEPALA